MMSNQDYRNPQDQYSPSTQPVQARSSVGAYLAGVATGVALLGMAGGGYALYRQMNPQPAPVALAPTVSAPVAPSAPAPAAPAPASSSIPAGSIASPSPAAATGTYEANGSDGQSTFNVRVLELKRVSGNSVLLRMSVTNTGRDLLSFGLLNVTPNESIYVVDTQTQQKAYPLQDSNGKALATEAYSISIDPQASTEIFAQFPAPPASTQKLTIYFPRASSPIADVPITQ